MDVRKMGQHALVLCGMVIFGNSYSAESALQENSGLVVLSKEERSIFRLYLDVPISVELCKKLPKLKDRQNFFNLRTTLLLLLSDPTSKNDLIGRYEAAKSKNDFFSNLPIELEKLHKERLGLYDKEFDEVIDHKKGPETYRDRLLDTVRDPKISATQTYRQYFKKQDIKQLGDLPLNCMNEAMLQRKLNRSRSRSFSGTSTPSDSYCSTPMSSSTERSTPAKTPSQTPSVGLEDQSVKGDSGYQSIASSQALVAILTAEQAARALQVRFTRVRSQTAPSSFSVKVTQL